MFWSNCLNLQVCNKSLQASDERRKQRHKIKYSPLFQYVLPERNSYVSIGGGGGYILMTKILDFNANQKKNKKNNLCQTILFS